MTSIRQKIQQQQKAPKRPRQPSDYDDSSLLPVQQPESDDNEPIEHSDAFESEEEENRPIVAFQRGTTIRGSLCFWHQGFRYTRNKGNFFRCSNRDCPATAKITNEETASGQLGPSEHNHLADPTQCEAELRRNNIKERTRDNARQKPSQVLAEVRANASDATYVAMGTDHTLKAMIRHQKKKVYGNVNRADPLTVVLPEVLLMKDGESCLLYDSREHRVGEPDVVLVFAHPKLLNILKQARKIAVDGTFRVSPAAWTQAFVVGAFVRSRLAMCAHALLPGKNRRYYSEALTVIKNAITPASPARVISDFETAAIQAIQDTFPTVISTGCLFHFTQAVFKKWRALGLAELHANDEHMGEAARTSFRMILALPLLPEQHVRRAFTLIVSQAPDGLAAFFGYFARTYIGLTGYEIAMGADAFTPNAEHSRRSSSASALLDHDYSGDNIQFGLPSPRPSTPTMSISTASTALRWDQPIIRQPRYAISFWNVHERARSMVEKTNNAMEASHLQFSRQLAHHPSLSDFLMAIQDDVDKQLDVARSARVFPHKRRTKYILKEQLIGDALDEAEYGTDADLMDILTLLSLQMQGYVGGLRARNIDGENNDTPD